MTELGIVINWDKTKLFCTETTINLANGDNANHNPTKSQICGSHREHQASNNEKTADAISWESKLLGELCEGLRGNG